jgi:hypothetical protein
MKGVQLMKKTGSVILIVLMVLTACLLAQDNTRGTASATFGGKKVDIEYGRPSLQGRDMISQLPVGGTWRMGMNTETSLTTEVTLDFDGKTVAPGKYRLTAKRVAEDKWHLVVTQDSGTVEVPLTAGAAGSPVETFTIELKAENATTGHFSMAWGALNVGTAFTVK